VIKAILFDMDGVLIDATDWHYEALNRALSLFGLAIKRESHLAVFDGLPTRQKLEILSKTRNFPRRLHPLVYDLKQAYTIELAHARCRPVFQHQYALACLKNDGYRLGVCSNSIRSTVHLMMSLARLDGYLEFVMSNEDVDKPKPEPEIYCKAIERLRLSPDEVLILEDNDHGIEAARASRAHLLVVKNTEDVNYSRICERLAELNGS
jgi:beta-phosphoglucomutase